MVDKDDMIGRICLESVSLLLQNLAGKISNMASKYLIVLGCCVCSYR